MTLLERNPFAPTNWYGSLPVPSRYTFGIAGERFFREIKDKGRIMGTYCPKCDHTYVPAVVFCERCLNELDQWEDVGLVGEVHSYTILHINYDGSRREEPEIVAFVKIKDGGIIHRLSGVTPDGLRIGILVKAIIKPPSERLGSILDIQFFQPVG